MCEKKVEAGKSFVLWSFYIHSTQNNLRFRLFLLVNNYFSIQNLLLTLNTNLHFQASFYDKVNQFWFSSSLLVIKQPIIIQTQSNDLQCNLNVDHLCIGIYVSQ